MKINIEAIKGLNDHRTRTCLVELQSSLCYAFFFFFFITLVLIGILIGAGNNLFSSMILKF